MSATPKKKLCWNCDGSMPVSTDTCPFCGVYVELSRHRHSSNQEPDLVPPYPMKNVRGREIPASPFSLAESVSRSSGEGVAAVDGGELADEVAISPAGEIKKVVSPLAFLLAGSVFFLFGLVLVLFSREGVFTLQWKGDYWYLYLFGGSALLFLGWRALRHLDEEEIS